MAVGKTFTADVDPTIDALALTYVVPTRSCDLRCAFCIVAQRREAGPWQLGPNDYVWFIRDVSDYVPVRVSGIQGFEPLLDDAWSYTEAILQVSRSVGVPTSVVTNGTRLLGRIDELDDLGLRDLTVSLDSADPEVHDRQRGVPGTFARTTAGIRAALRKPRFRERLVVAAVLLPGRRDQLDGMPSYLANLGVRYFGVTPLIRVRQTGGGIVQKSDALMQDLDALQDACDKAGIIFVVDDELQLYRHLVNGANRFMIHSLSRPGRLLRLTPSGACSIGVDVLRPIDDGTPVWDPAVEAPREFLQRLAITPEVYPLSARDALACR